jgi:8-oxo-dGTP diphosphatase
MFVNLRMGLALPEIYEQRDMMKISTNGIVIDQYGHVLLIQRDDTRTMAPPGGGLEKGELPTDNAAREIREETGLIALPVRLTGLYFWQWSATMPMLAFTFRCIQRGGELQTSPESLQVGFFKVKPLPRSLINIHRERVLEAWRHSGGPPIWKRQKLPFWGQLMLKLVRGLVYPWKNLRRRLKGDSPFVPAPVWHVAAFAVVRNEQGQVLWVKQPEAGLWQLPGGHCGANEAPWETAVRHTRQQTGLTVRLEDLGGVYVTENEAQMVLVFTAVVSAGQLKAGTETAHFTPGREPENCIAQHLQPVADAVGPHTETIFRHQNYRLGGLDRSKNS